MGNGATKTPAQWTAGLWKIINTDYYNPSVLQQAQQALECGAFITAPNRKTNTYMLPTVMQKRTLNATAGKEHEVKLYDQLIEILKEYASKLLAKLVIDEDCKNMNDIRLLTTTLMADCYQEKNYGPLGLLGQVLRKGSGSFELVQLLIENDERAKLGLGRREQDTSCIDIAKASNKKDITDYLQIQLNKLLNKMPFYRNDIPIEEINLWLVNGANTEWQDDGDTVLCKAVDADKLELCEILVVAGANTSVKNRNNQTPVQIARSKTQVNPQLIKILESRAMNDDLKSAIIHHDSIDDIRSILARGADIKASANANQDTFLHLLILNAGSADMVKIFVNEYNASISSLNVKGHRAIETAIVCDSDDETTCSILRTLFLLKQFTTDSFYNDKLKQSVLTFCDDQKKKLESRKLIQAELNQRLHKLCLPANNNADFNHKKEEEIIQDLAKLVKCGAQIDHQQESQDYSGWTVVHLLCRLGNLNLLKHAIETLKATTYNEPTTFGDYPVSIAAEYGHQSIVHYLRDTFDSISLNVSNSNGDSPLHKAAKNNHFLVVRYLVQWGADPQAINNVQQTPLSLVTLSEANKPMIQFLEHLIDTADDQVTQTRPSSAHRPADDFDYCDIVVPLVLDRTDPIFDTSPESNKSPGLLQDSPNEKLFKAAENGNLYSAKDAIATGADVRYLKNGRSSYVAAVTAAREFQNKWSRTNDYLEKQQLNMKMNNCNQVAEYLAEIARTQLTEAIKQGNAGWTIAYHQKCGATITPDLLTLACQNSKDNAEIVDYLVRNDQQTYKAMFNFDHGNDSPYSMALKKKYTNIANYIKWKLTEEMTKAVSQNDSELVKQLLIAGASADMKDTQNLDRAIRHNNSEMVRALCEHGARLPSSTVKTDSAQIKSILKRYKLNHQFREAAAHGKLIDLITYHRESADINAKNCHGATALLITVQSGEYYPIVHYLVSCGASMLHSDVTQPSLLALADKRKDKQIFDYLSRQLNTQFLSTILDNETSKTDALAQLGLDFNCTDEEARTPLHYAVQYHGVDLVKWLCNRGSNPMNADQNGDYPITLAAEKGDYAVIEYFIHEHGATKQLKNKQGLDVLAIAKRRRFNEIVQLLDPGNTQFKVTKGSKIVKPKYTNERLDRAVKNGETQIIKEFIDQEYQSLKEKTEQCGRMMEIARQGNHFEVLSMLQPHYAELSQELTSNQAASRLVNLSEVQLTMFYGFMNNLSDLITGSHVTLDPANPQTYKDLFSQIISTDQKRSQAIESLKTPQDSALLCQQELSDMQEKIENLNRGVGQMKLEKQKLTEQIHGLEKQLKDDNISAIDKKQYFQDKETTENALNALESSIHLARHAHETAEKKKNLLNYIRTTPNLFVFYATIEHRLQSLFNGVLAAQSQLFKTEYSTPAAAGTTFILSNAPLELIPLVGPVMAPIKGATQWLVDTLDKKYQKAEWYNISVLGNIEELQKAASTTAGLLTLYYNQQIQLIDTTSSNAPGSNRFGTAVAATTEFIQGSPEPESERTVVLTAQFLVELIIDMLKSQDRKTNEKKKLSDQIVPDKPLAEQLWLFVAKTNLLKSSNLESFMATTGFGLAKRLVLIRKRTDGQAIQVQVRQLFGYVSLITKDGIIYRTKIVTTEKDKPPEFDDVEEIFGYAVLDPFTADDATILTQIKESRNLEDHGTLHKDKVKAIANDEMVEGVQALRGVISENGSNEGITKRMALSVGKVLENEKVFLKKDEIDAKLNKHQVAINYDVNSLRDEMKVSIKKFQTSIDAAYEKIGKDFDDCTHKLQRDNQEQYQKALQKISEQQKQLEQRLEKIITTRLAKIEDDLKKKSDDMMAIANSAKQESQAAVETSKAAQDSSIKCEKEAKTASEKAEALVISTDQRKKEMQQTISDSMNLLQETIDEQKQAYQTSLDELQRQMKTTLETLRTSAAESSKRADDANKRANDTANQMKELVEIQKRETERQAKNQKDETDRLIKTQNDKMNELVNSQNKERKTFAEKIKEMTRTIEQAASESRNAANDAKRAAEASEKALKKASP